MESEIALDSLAAFESRPRKTWLPNANEGGASFLRPIFKHAVARSPTNTRAGEDLEEQHGFKVTATRVAAALSEARNTLLRLFKTNRATEMGALQSVTYIQRVEITGGTRLA